MKTMINGTTNVSQNTFESMKTRVSSVMHVETNLLNNEGDIQFGKGKILHGTRKIAI